MLSSRHALKEWNATCRALAEGRQIILLRKGGLLDEDGVFALEQSAFWMLPTAFHQEPHLLKKEHLNLLDESTFKPHHPGDDLQLQLFATVAKVWALDENAEEALANLPHIWTNAYLDGRWSYKPDHPLLCVALRIYRDTQIHHVNTSPAYFGCRSWIDLPEELALLHSEPVLGDAEFEERLGAIERALR
jgi:hypothetical protein